MVAARTRALGARTNCVFFAVLASAFLLAASACSGSSESSGPTTAPVSSKDGKITVVSTEWEFEPQTIILQLDQEVALTLVNDGEILHNLKVDDLQVNTIEEISSGGFSGEDDELFVGAASGDVGLLRFIPLEPGEYEFYCTIGSHRQLGMAGLLTIQ